MSKWLKGEMIGMFTFTFGPPTSRYLCGYIFSHSDLPLGFSSSIFWGAKVSFLIFMKSYIFTFMIVVAYFKNICQNVKDKKQYPRKLWKEFIVKEKKLAEEQK